MGQEVHVVCPVAATQTLERSAGKATTTVAVPVLEPAGQLLHATVEAVLNLAVEHAEHVVAPVPVSVLVTDPAAQAVQLFAVHEAEQPAPVDGVKRYLPAAQAMHDVAPVLEPVLVMEPAAQAVQLASVQEEEQPAPVDGVRRYLPAAQAMHDVAPVLKPVLVMEPAAQLVQPVFVAPVL